jgi:hypothetical protein
MPVRPSPTGVREIEVQRRVPEERHVLDLLQGGAPSSKTHAMDCEGQPRSCFRRENRSSNTAPTTAPSRNRQAAVSTPKEMPRMSTG